MEIKAKCKFDLNSIKALTHLSMFKKANPKKRMIIWAVIYAIIWAVVIAEIVAFGPDTTLWILFGLSILIMLFECYLYFLSPRIRYKSLAKLKETENEYVFYDDFLKIISKTEEYNGESEINYSLFVKAYETSKYFFLFQTNHQVYLIDKSTIKGGNIQDIRDKMTVHLKDKYILCKY